MGLDAPPLEDAAVTAARGTALRAGLLALAVAAGGCQPDRSRPAEAAGPPRPQATLHGVRMRVFRGDELAMLGRAARLSFHRSTREVTAEEALLQFHPRSRPVELRAPRLRGNLDSRGADLEGGVRLKGPANLTGETPSAHFDVSAMVATGTQPVKLRGPGYALESRGGFEMNFGEETFDFHGDVATVIEGARP